jgi:hypothetical protein
MSWTSYRVWDGVAMQLLPDDMVVSVLEFMELDTPDLEALTCDFPEGGHSRARMEYRLETQYLLDERDLHYIQKLKTGRYRNLRNVPVAHRTKNVCYTALDENFMRNFPYVPDKFKTVQMCEWAVSNFGQALEFVPEQFKTEALCELAVSKFGQALEFVPEQFKTEALCELAVSRFGQALGFVPEQFKTEALCEWAVFNFGQALEFVPEQFKTEALCWKAVIYDSYDVALDFVPEQFYEDFIDRLEKRNMLSYSRILGLWAKEQGL